MESEEETEPTLRDIYLLLRRIEDKLDNINTERLSVHETEVQFLKGGEILDEEEKELSVEQSSSKRSSRNTLFEKEVELVTAKPEGEQRIVVINMHSPDFENIFLDERRPIAKLGADETDSDGDENLWGEEVNPARDTPGEQPEPEPPDPLRAQLKAISDSSASNGGCVNCAIYGNCFRGDECKNAQGHNEQSAKQTREWLIKKLATVERDGYQKTILKRDQTKA